MSEDTNSVLLKLWRMWTPVSIHLENESKELKKLREENEKLKAEKKELEKKVNGIFDEIYQINFQSMKEMQIEFDSIKSAFKTKLETSLEIAKQKLEKLREQ